MLFTSMEFLLLFMPVTFGVYYLLPRRLKNYWLLAASLFFYAWGEPSFVYVMLCSIGINYLIALRIDRARGKNRSAQRLWLLAALVFDLGILFVYKYLGFLLTTAAGLFPKSMGALSDFSIPLPIGISFFLFQILSYVIDVYRGEAAQKNPFSLGLYIALFPQLIAGPIVRYTGIRDQLTDREITREGISKGAIRFMLGFNKKMLLANTLSELADLAFAAQGGYIGMAWLGAISYSLQIYFDFSAYSDMAIGMGRMLGFRFPENFDYPYSSQTVTEFWRRWHISLGSWFRDYVYVPLGGSRVDSKRKLIRNLLLVWLLTGIWHGANWTFVLWGLLYGCALTVEKLCDLPAKLTRRSAGSRMAYRALTLLLVMLGWVLFRSDSLSDAASYIGAMFSPGGTQGKGAFVFYAREYAAYLAFGVLCATPFFRRCGERLRRCSAAAGAAGACIFYTAQLICFVWSFSCLVMNAHNPFIYFNF